MRHAFAAFAAFVAVLILGLPASAGAAEKSIWGPLDLPGGRSAFPTYRELGVDSYQMSIDMASVAPTRPADITDPADPAYRWPAEIDEAIRRSGRENISVAILAYASPPWANGGRSTLHAPDPRLWAPMMTALSRRYPSVRKWMIWGEPNRADRFLPNTTQGPAGPRAYAPLLDASYVALKRVSPANIVIGGMTWTGGTVKPAYFLRYMRMPNGRPPRLDWFGHNPFPFRFPNLAELPIRGGWRDLSDLDTFSRELKRVYGKRTKLWLSEFTVQSDKKSREFELQVSQAEQARWLAAAYRVADQLPGVAGLGWLGLLDERQAAGSSTRGLMTSRGDRKPAFAAFRGAPATRFRPDVRVAKRIRATSAARSGVRVLVRPSVSGVAKVTIERGGERVATVSRKVRAGRLVALRLRWRRPRRGVVELVVRAPRGDAARRSIRVR